MKKLVILLSALCMGICFSNCSSHIPDKNGNKKGVKNGVITKGVFSVSEDKKVRFSMGNLQYQPSTKTWRFASQQYEYIGARNKYIRDKDYDSWIDLFGWGTGDHPTNCSMYTASYIFFVDWGKNSISNGGNKPYLWRTLTADEWEYIFRKRPFADMLYGFVYISIGDDKEVFGRIILPDDWKTPTDIIFNAGVENDEDWNHYTHVPLKIGIVL